RARGGDDFIVFFRLERACRIDDRLTREIERAGEQLALQLRKRREIAFAKTPFDLGILANGAGRAARRVEQHDLKLAAKWRAARIAHHTLSVAQREQPCDRDVVAPNSRAAVSHVK